MSILLFLCFLRTLQNILKIIFVFAFAKQIGITDEKRFILEVLINSRTYNITSIISQIVKIIFQISILYKWILCIDNVKHIIF